MHRQLLRVVLILLVLVWSERAASACSCLSSLRCGADSSDVVFVGQMLELSTYGDYAVGRFRVEQAGKGVQPGEIVSVSTSPGNSGACGLDFNLKGRWMINARRAGKPSRGWPADVPWAPLFSGTCDGSGRVRDGDSGPVFPRRSDVDGRVLRWTPDGRFPHPGFPAVAGVRVWVRTPARVIETQTDDQGRFLLRDVPLIPSRQLHVDVGPGDAAWRTTLATWTPAACRPLLVFVAPRKPSSSAPTGQDAHP